MFDLIDFFPQIRASIVSLLMVPSHAALLHTLLVAPVAQPGQADSDCAVQAALSVRRAVSFTFWQTKTRALIQMLLCS